MRLRKSIALGLLLSVLVSGVAFAEGYWSSYMTNFGRGMNSRNWNDYHNDAAHTIIRLEGCRDEVAATNPNDWAVIRLWKHAGLFPPYSMGDKTFNCYYGAQRNWGEQTGPQWFNFSLQDFSGGTAGWNVFDAASVEVWY